DESIDFENKGYDLPSLDNLPNYCEKLEEFINKLNDIGDMVAGKLYTQENDKTFTFSKLISIILTIRTKDFTAT
ncbi:41384_t:CDS:2, partial [Gigaspora margarita]